MRILVLSDLHLEHWRGRSPLPDLMLSTPDIVVLAGDIAQGADAVEWAADTFKPLPVLYVAGNHEFYGGHVGTVLEAIKAACSTTANVHFLDRNSFSYHGVRFLGATLWTDFNLFHDTNFSMRVVQNSLNDYRLIETGVGRTLTVEDTLHFHLGDIDFVDRMLDCDDHNHRKTVCITHHAPSFRSVPMKFRYDLVSAGYASNLDHVASKADLWIHGHTHDSFDYMIEQCRVVCNPCGYPLVFGKPENTKFNPNFIVEI